MYSLGIDIGYSAVKAAVTDENNKIIHTKYLLHKGDIKGSLEYYFEELIKGYGSGISLGAVTGRGKGFLTNIETIESVNEVAAVVEGGLKINENINSIMDIGGQGAKYITGFRQDNKTGIKISMNSNCSAGTGSFLEEQVSRLNLKLEDYSIYAARAKSIPRIAGRCSVFAKTDITHHQQEGTPVDDILLGLAYSVVKNYRVGVMKRLPVKKPILLAGGVAHNQGIIKALKDVFKLEDNDLIIPEHSSDIGTVGAIGAAILARKNNRKINLHKILNHLKHLETELQDNEISLPPLISFGRDDSINKHKYPEEHDSHNKYAYQVTQGDSGSSENAPGSPGCFLGIDVGSTSTNLILSDKNNKIIAHKYLRTKGDPVSAVTSGLRDFKNEFANKVKILGAGVTGSGRHLIARLVGADVIKDEITAQAKAAVVLDPCVDTIFEIGGQDSKFISIKNGRVTDFQMNKICAAGTGSFIEEQAKKFKIPINTFGQIALNSNHPIALGERCTVFIETSIASYLSKGAKINDIASGLCYSIVKNYLNRVVGQKKIGEKIFFQGGLAYNQGVINAFRSILRKDIRVPLFFSVTGAFGAAILAREEMGNKASLFKGFDIEVKENFYQNKINFLIKDSETFAQKVESLIFKGYDNSINPEKKTVGIPRALFTFGMFSMFNTFFKELGFNVIMSDPSNEDTIKLSQEYSLDETCYPVKLINGHVAQLVAKKVDYIFFPDLYTVNHPESETRQNYGCAYMQLAFKIVSQAMGLDKTGIKLLAPTIAFNQGQKFMMKSFAGLGKNLGRNQELTSQALIKGMEAFHEFELRLKKNQAKVIGEMKPDEKIFVIISKIYGVADPVLNMGIPDRLRKMGYKTISFFDLPQGNIFAEHPNMYWPFAQHILDPAYLIKEHPNLYAILLTHHGCGPDSVVSHFFNEIMTSKPFLNIEVDEHASTVGVMTRLEAFVNSLGQPDIKNTKKMEYYQKKIIHKKVNINTSLNQLNSDTILYLPNIYPYSDIFSQMLGLKGIDARVLPMTTRTSLDMGREHTITNEYFSMTALAGDIFYQLSQTDRQNSGKDHAFLIPQTEGAEVDGQYNRFIRTKLDENGFHDVKILSPFIEDLILGNDSKNLYFIFSGLMAGDIIRTAPKKYRNKHLSTTLNLIKNKMLSMDRLKHMARQIDEQTIGNTFKKRIFAMGEPLILFNDFLNNYSFAGLEDKGHRVIFAPLSEYMLVLWQDFVNQNGEKKEMLNKKLDELRDYSSEIAKSFNETLLEKDLSKLITLADKTLGFYAGTNGRYRESKILGDLNNIDGVMTATSMYENTGIALDILHRGFKNKSKPVLNLTFDGNKNENDETKMEAFIFYLTDNNAL